MDVKQYLSQAHYLDLSIDSKLEQLSRLNSLATKATATLSDMPHSPNRGGSSLEDTICKIVDLQAEINRDIDRLVDLKKSIIALINKVENDEYRLMLEKRYLNFMSWEVIAVSMNFSRANVFKVHDKAIEKVAVYYYADKEETKVD
jgi:DNA-directed RNA polymerase specialized sigma subunit